jgi:hypothetical protein
MIDAVLNRRRRDWSGRRRRGLGKPQFPSLLTTVVFGAAGFFGFAQPGFSNGSRVCAAAGEKFPATSDSPAAAKLKLKKRNKFDFLIMAFSLFNKNPEFSACGSIIWRRARSAR